MSIAEENRRHDEFARTKGTILMTVLLACSIVGSHPETAESSSGHEIKATAMGSARYAVWHDPNEQAFSLLIPRGWRAQGGVVRPSLLLIQGAVEVKSPDGEIYLSMGDKFPLFTEPNATLSQLFGINEGGTYFDGSYASPVRSYAPGSEFVARYLLPTRGNNVKVFKKQERRDLTRTYSFPALSIGFNTGEVEYEVERNGRSYRGGALCVTRILASGAGRSWHVWRLFLFEAPENRVEEAKAALVGMAMSLRFNPRWLETVTKGSAQQAEILRDMNNTVSNTISQSYWRRQAVMDSIFKRDADARRGILDLADPYTGEVYSGVTNQHNYYWINPQGRVIGSETFTPPGADFRQLVPVP